MTISKAEPVEKLQVDQSSAQSKIGLGPLVGYFLKLGTIGFGGPAALVGFMHRDLVEQRRWITEDTYKLSLALAQIMPGPLAAQTAIAIGYFEGGVLGATLVGLGFIVPSFLMVVAISLAYVASVGFWWMNASTFLHHRRNSYRNHRDCCVQAGARHQQAQSAPLGHLCFPHSRNRMGPDRIGRVLYPCRTHRPGFSGLARLENRDANGARRRSARRCCWADGGVARACSYGRQQWQCIN